MHAATTHGSASTVLSVAILVTALTVSACSGSSSPTAPTPPPNVLGAWSGTYLVSTCTETGSAIGTAVCANIRPGGSLSYTPTQTGSTLGGNVGIGSFIVPVSGSVGTDNVVTLAGTGEMSGFSITINSFRSTLGSPNQMTGTMTFTILVSAPLGTATVQATTTLQR